MLHIRRQITGFTLVELLVVIAIIGVLTAFLLPAVQSVREASRRSVCLHNLHQISVAVMNYEGAAGKLPPSAEIRGLSALGNSGSWGVHGRLLPYLEQDVSFEQINTKLAWAQRKAIDGLRVPAFSCQNGPDAATVKNFHDDRPSLWPTTYGFNFGTWFVYNPVSFEGGDGVFFPDSNLKLSRIIFFAGGFP